MRYLSRLKTGFLLSVASLRVLRDHPKLAIYPLASGIASSVFVLALLDPLFLVGEAGLGELEIAALFVVYLGSTYITALFNAGLVHSVGQTFHGDEPPIGDGLRVASNKSGPLLVWAFASAVVGIVLQTLESRGGIGARIAAFVFSVGWPVATFFVIPVIVFVVQTGVTIVTAMVIAILSAVVAMLVGGIITGVLKAAFYVYATEDLTPEEFERLDFDLLFESAESNPHDRFRRPSGRQTGNLTVTRVFYNRKSGFLFMSLPQRLDSSE